MAPSIRGNKSTKERNLLAIRLMRTGAKKRPSYRIVVKEKQSKRDGAYLENLGTYNPTREPAEINLKADAWTTGSARVPNRPTRSAN
jgi:small subunit ribosomal protein S16